MPRTYLLSLPFHPPLPPILPGIHFPGIPFGTVNLKRGVPIGETTVSSLAGAGSLSLEFSVLSALTGDGVFAQVWCTVWCTMFDTKRLVVFFAGTSTQR